MKNKITILATVLTALVFAGPALASADVSITLNGANPVTLTAGSPFVEPGFTAFSTVDGDISSQVSETPVNTSTVGDSTVNYSVTDSALDTATASRGVVVTSNGGGGLIYCSGPMAPGYVAGTPGGGCGSPDYVPFNGPTPWGPCAFSMGCTLPKQ